MKASSAVFLQELNFTELQESEKSFANWKNCVSENMSSGKSYQKIVLYSQVTTTIFILPPS